VAEQLAKCSTDTDGHGHPPSARGSLARPSPEDRARRIGDKIQPNPLLMSNLGRINELLLKPVASRMRVSIILLAPVYAE
jgi:hypothetical protein